MLTTDANEQVLVTGGTGFTASHCILQLLQMGYRVRATLRSLKKQGEVIAMLRAGGIQSFEKLSFIEAKLTEDDNWDKAVKDCVYVLHIASPAGLTIPKHEDELIIPAVKGTLRVLRAARDGGIKRVVMTSDIGAAGCSGSITEGSCTRLNEKGLSAYTKSKVMSEKAAWNFMRNEGHNLELAVINPACILGPALGPRLSRGAALLKQLLDGSMKFLPDIPIGIVDVRDVAELHILVMLDPAAKGQRFPAIADEILLLPQIAKILKDEAGDGAGNISTKKIPDWVVRMAALFSKKAKNIVPQLKNKHMIVSNAKSRTLPGMNFRSNTEAIRAMAASLLEYNLKK
jgi:nucleoside-diphosphate-sugar epimerase